MARIDGYLRSIEKFGALGATLASGQAVTLRFPGGDRQATQLTPHDQLVAMVREVASIEALTMIDGNRPAHFEFVSAGVAYAAQVTPKPGAWTVVLTPQVAIAATPVVATVSASPSSARASGAVVTVVSAGDGMDIERSQYDEAPESATTGSTLLDQLFSAARAVRASDLYLAADSQPMVRVAGELQSLRDVDSGAFASLAVPIDGDRLQRELGIVAPAEQRDGATAAPSAFVYGNQDVRMRISLGRDRRGATAAIRLMVPEPPAPERLGLPAAAIKALHAQRGLFIVTGGPGCGKTTSLASFVHGQTVTTTRFIVELSLAIEMVHQQRRAIVSQRAVGEHIDSYAIGIAAALRESADVIVVGDCDDTETAQAIVSALNAGALLMVAVPAVDVATSLLHIARLADASYPDRALATLANHFVAGTAQTLVKKADGSGRFAAFEVVIGTDAVRSALTSLSTSTTALQQAIAAGASDGMSSMSNALNDAARRGAK
jgi:twitching motility protein PilT